MQSERKPFDVQREKPSNCAASTEKIYIRKDLRSPLIATPTFVADKDGARSVSVLTKGNTAISLCSSSKEAQCFLERGLYCLYATTVNLVSPHFTVYGAVPVRPLNKPEDGWFKMGSEFFLLQGLRLMSYSLGITYTGKQFRNSRLEVFCSIDKRPKCQMWSQIVPQVNLHVLLNESIKLNLKWTERENKSKCVVELELRVHWWYSEDQVNFI